MSFFNGSALAVMVKSMFPSIFQRVEELEADGTIDKVNDLLKTLSTNGTFDALKELAVKIDRHNGLLEEIRNEMVAQKDEAFKDAGSAVAERLRPIDESEWNGVLSDAGSDAGGYVGIRPAILLDHAGTN